MTYDCHCLDAIFICRHRDVAFVCRRRGATFICVIVIQTSKVY